MIRSSLYVLTALWLCAFLLIFQKLNYWSHLILSRLFIRGDFLWKLCEANLRIFLSFTHARCVAVNRAVKTRLYSTTYFTSPHKDSIKYCRLHICPSVCLSRTLAFNNGFDGCGIFTFSAWQELLLQPYLRTSKVTKSGTKCVTTDERNSDSVNTLSPWISRGEHVCVPAVHRRSSYRLRSSLLFTNFYATAH